MKEEKKKHLINLATRYGVTSYELYDADEVYLTFQSYISSNALKEMHNGYPSNTIATQGNFVVGYLCDSELYVILRENHSYILHKEGTIKPENKKCLEVFWDSKGFIIDTFKLKKVKPYKTYYR